MQVNLQMFDSVGELEEYINRHCQRNVITMLVGKDSIVKNGAYVFSAKIKGLPEQKDKILNGMYNSRKKERAD